MFYTLARFILFLFFKICFRLKIFGTENFPRNGPLIVASNHTSFLDPVVAGLGAPRKLHFLARDSLFKFRPFANIIKMLNAIPLRRETGDVNAFRISLRKLSEGNALLIFPEGTRSRDGTLQRPRYGIGFLAAKSEARILPCYIKGAAEVLPRHYVRPRLRPISIYFGRSFRLDKNFCDDEKQLYAHVSEQVMEEIARLKKKAEQGIL